MKRSYSTDLADAEWKCLEPYVPPANKRGRPRAHAAREILDAVFYILKSGCPWRLLPREFPPWETVYCWGSGGGATTGRGRSATLRERLRVRAGEGHSSERRGRRLSVDQDHRDEWRAEGIRRRQEG